jgi:hypothetical protein
MNKKINIYCDESCHLENDKHKAMTLGAVWCDENDKQFLFERIKDIKLKHKLKSNFEIKWNKVSKTKLKFYRDIINFFFDTDKINFRALIVPDKSVLDHEKYEQTHDDFYYKIYFDMLKIIIEPKSSHYIYIDIKDTRGFEKTLKLKEIIRTENYDFEKNIIKRIQEVRSDEVVLIQIADLLIGALSYFHRGLSGSEAKLDLIELIKKRTSYSLSKSTLPSERKFNMFIWQTGYKRRCKNGGV